MDPSSPVARGGEVMEDIQALFADHTAHAAVEVEIEMPTSKRGMKKFTQNPVAYLAQKLKAKQVEVHDRQLEPQELEQFQKAKQMRSGTSLRPNASACGKEGDPGHAILGVRWLLSWKYDGKYKDQGGKKAKARAIILDYQDNNYQHRETCAPTPSKSGRQLYFQMEA